MRIILLWGCILVSNFSALASTNCLHPQESQTLALLRAKYNETVSISLACATGIRSACLSTDELSLIDVLEQKEHLGFLNLKLLNSYTADCVNDLNACLTESEAEELHLLYNKFPECRAPLNG